MSPTNHTHHCSEQQNPPIMTLMAGENEPLDLVTIRATVRRALQERAALPRAGEIREITGTLRGHLQRMLLEAQNRANQLHRGTDPWLRWTALINRAHDDLQRDGGSGLCSAATYMKELGRTCRYLADCLDE